MKVDEPVKHIRRVVGRRDHICGACQQPRTDSDQQLDQQRLLVGEVPVDRGTADTGGGTDVLQPHREKTALGDKALPAAISWLRRSDLARLRRVVVGVDTDEGAICHSVVVLVDT